jgi:molecular chaperone GrpE
MEQSKKGPVTRLKEENERLRQESQENYNNYLRALADFDNFRKRIVREMESFRDSANENLLGALIPVLENLDRALLSASVDKNFDGLYQGMEIICRQFKEVLAKQGLVEYSCVGDEFDPKRCEAVNFVETDENPPNTVIEEIAKGYLFNNRVIRPSLVTVSKSKTAAPGGEK